MPLTTVSAKLLEPVLQLARHYRQPDGQDLQKTLLEIAALPEQEFTKPGARFPAVQFPQVLAALAEISENPLIALQLGEATQPRMLGSIGFMMSTAPTLEQAYQTLIDYLPLLFEGAALQMEQQVDGTRLSVELNQNDPHAVRYFLACLINWPRWLTGRQVPVLQIQMTQPVPERVQPYQQFFAAEIEFDAARNQILLSNDYLSLPCVDANSEMHHLHREFADSLLSKTAQQSALTAQTRNLIRQQLTLGGNVVRREAIAESLGLSLRTLQRKLGQQGSNFQTIYDQTRREVCVQLIQRGQLSFGEISFQLGFSNQSAFQKAFKRWMGVSPSTYRQQVKPLAPESVAPQAPLVQDHGWLSASDRATQLQAKLSRLSHFSLELLDWAAVAGEQFDLNSLAVLTNNPVARLAIHFWPSEQAGLICPLEDNRDRTLFRFADQSLQQQFYDRISAQERSQLHRQFADHLYQQLDDTPTLDSILPVLTHLLGCEQTEPETFPEAAQHQHQYQHSKRLYTLSQKASALAFEEKRFDLASHYMALACNYGNAGADQLLQCTKLHLLAGETDAAEARLQQLDDLTLDNPQRCRLALLTAKTLRYQGKPEQALCFLLTQLGELDQPLPARSDGQLNLLLQQLTSISERFSAHTLAELEYSASTTQQYQLQLLEQIVLLARQQSNPLLAACAIGRMTELSLQTGRTPLTAFAFVSYGWVASWFCADYSLAQTFAAQGMQLAQQQRSGNDANDTGDLAQSALFIHSAQVAHWFTPLAQIEQQLQQTAKHTQQQGQWLLFEETSLLSTQLELLGNTPLPQQQLNLQQQLAHCPDTSRAEASALAAIQWLTEESTMPPTVSYQHGWQAITTIISALLLDQQHLWPGLYHWEAPLEQEMAGYFGVSEALFCCALMRLIQGQQQQGLSRRRQREVEQLLSRFELWSKHCPHNFNAQRYLLQAELARLKTQPAGALFEQALQAARKARPGYLLALIHERYSEYLAANGQTTLARFCLNEARWFYQQWGADAKVKQLAQPLSLLAQ